MTERKKHVPSKTTLKVRAFGKVQRIKDRIAEKRAIHAQRAKKMEAEIKALQAQEQEALKAYQTYVSPPPPEEE